MADSYSANPCDYFPRCSRDIHPFEKGRERVGTSLLYQSGRLNPRRGLSERGAAVGGSVASRTVVTHLSCAEVGTTATAAAAGGDVM